MIYGIPYKGSKGKIAKDIIHVLPPGKRLVDLFGGGFAITHCALLEETDKWESVMYNDINPLLPPLITDAINGKYDTNSFVPEFITREEFFEKKDIDGYIKWVWSFGNNGNEYLYSREKESVEADIYNRIVHGSSSEYIDDILVEGDSIEERRLDCIKKCPSKRLYPIERINRLNRLHLLQTSGAVSRLEPLQNMSYEDYRYQDGDVVYCDIPYEQSSNKKTDYIGGFNHNKFYRWALDQDFPVYFSSYPLFDKVWEKNITTGMCATNNAVKRVECLYKTA